MRYFPTIKHSARHLGENALHLRSKLDSEMRCILRKSAACRGVGQVIITDEAAERQPSAPKYSDIPKLYIRNR